MANSKKRKYQEFLKSAKWQALRKLALKRAYYECAACGSWSDLQVHHRDYTRFGGKELPDDLLVLCKACHRKHHDLRFFGNVPRSDKAGAEKLLAWNSGRSARRVDMRAITKRDRFGFLRDPVELAPARIVPVEEYLASKMG